MIAQKSDLFIWGGDIIYADWDSDRTIKEAYTIQNSHPDYLQLKSTTPVIGTWDDHDFGLDNADGNFPKKFESQKYFLVFLDVPWDSPRRAQEEVYTSYDIGKFKIILLDNRYFKNLESDAPMLGKKQWEWPEKIGRAHV